MTVTPKVIDLQSPPLFKICNYLNSRNRYDLRLKLYFKEEIIKKACPFYLEIKTSMPIREGIK